MSKQTWIKVDDGHGHIPDIYSEPTRSAAMRTAKAMHGAGPVGRVTSLYAADPAKYESEPYKVLGARAARLQS